MPTLPELAQKHGLKLTAGAWLDRDREKNVVEVDALIRAARSHASIERVIVGNEAILRGDVTVDELIKKNPGMVQVLEPKLLVALAACKDTENPEEVNVQRRILVAPGAEVLVHHAVPRPEQGPGHGQVPAVGQVRDAGGGVPCGPQRVRPFYRSPQPLPAEGELMHGEVAFHLVILAQGGGVPRAGHWPRHQQRQVQPLPGKRRHGVHQLLRVGAGFGHRGVEDVENSHGRASYRRGPGAASQIGSRD